LYQATVCKRHPGAIGRRQLPSPYCDERAANKTGRNETITRNANKDDNATGHF